MNSLNSNNSQPNTIVYVDYENILELLSRYHKTPLELDFFRVIQGHLAASGVKVIDFIVYGNFEKKTSNSDQSFLRAMGLQTRHASNNGKNSGDLELTVDALKDLYRNPSIGIFVIISSDRDIIPLLKAIKYENKLTYVISTQTGFNQIVTKYADFHEYIETIFKLAPLEPRGNFLEPDEFLKDYDLGTASPADIKRAGELAQYFYHSHIWTKSSILGKPVSLKGYLDVVARVVKRPTHEIMDDFKLAHALGYITIYRDPERGLCIKEGAQMPQVFDSASRVNKK